MKQHILLVIFMTFLTALFGCRASEEQIYIRIQNNSSIDITQFWLGSGSGFGGERARSYGAIDRGDTTPYKSFKATYGAYGNYNFLADEGQRYMGSTFPKEEIGIRELMPGYYTFVITIIDGEAVLRIVHDRSP